MSIECKMTYSAYSDRGKIEIMNNHNLLCLEFAAAC